MSPDAAVQGSIWLVDAEIGEPLPDLLAPDDHREARVLVRLHGCPIGTLAVRLDGSPVPASWLATAIWERLADAIVAHCHEDGLPVPTALPPTGLAGGAGGAPLPCSWRFCVDGAELPLATIVITTCEGSPALVETTAGALAQTYPHFEVVVVDNRPASSGVAGVLAAAFPGEARLHLVTEARPGLSHARNRGAAAARGDLIAFTDDDVVIDPDWLGHLVAGFEQPTVACVTGLILPRELETAGQRLVEEFGGYAKGFERRTWDCREHRAPNFLYPYTVGVFGSGANAAFRREALTDVGGFDGSLGAGTRARGGEDLDIYVACIQQGFQIRYEPAAIVRHAHPRDLEAVRRKIRDYGVGLGAMLTKHLVRDWPTCAALLARVPLGLRHLLSHRSTKNAGKSTTYPSSLTRAELVGLAYGPLAYLRSRIGS
ncbi:MAG TPA: glycosyltransferase [Acidimicrobiales bacterium]|jgi:GT2 family glycosyltransferase|nr:glycosyltransferase [Acidimicrobiales bacterium]